MPTPSGANTIFPSEVLVEICNKSCIAIQRGKQQTLMTIMSTRERERDLKWGVARMDIIRHEQIRGRVKVKQFGD